VGDKLMRFRLLATIAEIKARTNLRELATELGLEGKWNSFRCPFHDDRNPSLCIKPNGYICFSCGAKGDAVAFVMGLKRIGFLEAAEYLARRAGVSLPNRSTHRTRPNASPSQVQPKGREIGETKPPADPNLKTEIYTAIAKAALLRENYPPHTKAITYLRGRGISPGTAITAGVGAIFNYKGASQELLKKVGLLDLRAVGPFNKKGNFKLFKHQLLFPYRIDGEVAMLQARNTGWKN
jgi:DNA primase